MDESAAMARWSPNEFATWLEACQEPIFGFLRGLVGEREAARDLVQEVFVRAWDYAQRGAAPFDHDRPEAERRRWLFHVAYTRAMSLRQRERLIRWETLDDEHLQNTLVVDSPESHFIAGDDLRAALSTLAPRDAAVLLLNALQDFTATEIAAISGDSPGAVARRLSRARAKLRAAYQSLHAPERTMP